LVEFFVMVRSTPSAQPAPRKRIAGFCFWLCFLFLALVFGIGFGFGLVRMRRCPTGTRPWACSSGLPEVKKANGGSKPKVSRKVFLSPGRPKTRNALGAATQSAAWAPVLPPGHPRHE
jgi:hypothetical protein